ncbi:MAG TPA: zinc-binding dehydrogenase [Streptosporangiaceae bacterium]|nr:zinc-binding dehydrogenase [Streptosporangiaceae bacterium]
MVIEDVSGPGPARAGNVIVRAEAVGICGSDFHLFSGDVAALSGARDVELADWTSGDGPPLVVETSGETAILPQAVNLVSPAGRVVVVGMSSGTAPLRPGAFPGKEIDVIGSSCATAGDFRAAISLVKANQASIAALFSHHFPLTRAAEAFEFAMKRPPDAIKIVVTVN